MANWVGLLTIQTVLGHSQLSTTKRYTHVPMEVTKTALAGLESLVESTRRKPESQPGATPAANQRQSEPIH